VLDVTKFDINPRWPNHEKKAALTEWCAGFDDRCAHQSVALKVVHHEIFGGKGSKNISCGYLTIRNDVRPEDRASLSVKLSGLDLSALSVKKRRRESDVSTQNEGAAADDDDSRTGFPAVDEDVLEDEFVAGEYGDDGDEM
jgi:hypothetical protein